MFKQILYETDRLYLKVLKPGYYRKVLEYYRRNHNFLKEWEPKRPKDFYTAAYQKRQLRYEYNMFKSRKTIRFWIFKKEDDKLIGNICFTNIIMGNFKSCFMGYKLDSYEINKGYMTEAIREAVRIMFDDYGLHRIEANILPRNIRSLKVMKKLNFEQEGYSKRYLEINGRWEDHIHFAIYEDDLTLFF